MGSCPEMTAELTVSIAVLSAAALVHGITGVGFGLTAMSLFSVTRSAFSDSAAIVGAFALIVYVLLFLVSSRKAVIRWYEVFILSAGGFVGIAAGYGFLLIIQNPAVLKILIGTAIAGLSILSLFQQRINPAFRKTWWKAVATGFLGGFVFAVFIAGGVLIALYLYSDSDDPADPKPTLQVILIVLGLMRLIVFGVGLSGFSSGVSETLLFSLLPLTGALFAGHYLSTKVSREAFRQVLFFFLAAMGTAVAVLGGTGLL